MKTKVTYDELLEKIPNKYKLAMTLGKRYGQLVAGEIPLIKARKKETKAEIASREVLEGKVELVRVTTEG